jgi:hypothetical protein
MRDDINSLNMPHPSILMVKETYGYISDSPARPLAAPPSLSKY